MDVDSRSSGHRPTNGPETQNPDREGGRDHIADSTNTKDSTHSNKKGDEQLSNSNLDDNDDDDKEGDDEDDDDKEKVIEKSHNERFLKKNAQIFAYKVPGVNAYASFEIKTGKEVLWNDVICDTSETKEGRLLTQLKKMRRSHHPNCMRILDCWRNEKKSRISFITERPDETYTTLRHWFNISRLSRNSLTTKRLIRQVVAGLKYFADHSLVHGNISVDSILIHGTNIKLGPFSLDGFWHTHTVRKGGAKNDYYLSNDWSDPSVRITSLSDAYAMGIVCLEMALWCSLDSDSSVRECDIPKYVNEKADQLDDSVLRNFVKVCISGDRQHGIAELFDLSAFFEPPSLRHVAAKVITDGVVAHFASQQQAQQQSGQSGQTGQATTSAPSKQTADINGAYQSLLRSARSSFEDDSVIVKVVRRDGTCRQLLFKDVTQYYISFKFLEDVDHGYYPLIKFDTGGRAIVPAHVHRIINGDWRKSGGQSDAEPKEKDKSSVERSSAACTAAACAPASAVTSGGAADATSGSGAAVGEAKLRKDSRDSGVGGAEASSDKVSPPRGAAASQATGGPGGSTAASATGQAGSSGAALVVRPPVPSPARQAPPSKLPVADVAGGRRAGPGAASASGAGGAKTGDASGAAGAGGGSSAAGSGAATAAAAAGAAAGQGGAQGAGAASGGSGRSHAAGVPPGGGRDAKRLSSGRLSHSGASAPGGLGSSGAGTGTAGTGGTASVVHQHGHVVRRPGSKSGRGPPRTSPGSVITMRRRGGSTSPMPQRSRVSDASGRVTRGGINVSSGRCSHSKTSGDSSSNTVSEGPNNSEGQRGRTLHSRPHSDGSSVRMRRTTNDSGSRENRRSSGVFINEKRLTSDDSTEKTASAVEGHRDSEISSAQSKEERSCEHAKDAANIPPAEHRESQLSQSEESDYDDFDYYEDDIEEVGEEDDYDYQFPQRANRHPDEQEANIVDVDQPAEEERGKAIFTDVYYEYLGLGKWLLVVKFYLMRCREDPRGNLFRELTMQLGEDEWHDIDILSEILTTGLIMRADERAQLRQYLDAARHNRPLRETLFQESCQGPDPQDLAKRLQEVQERQWKEAADVSDVLGDESAVPVIATRQHHDDKSGINEPRSSIDYGDQAADGEIDRARSHLETPMSEAAASVSEISANRSRAESRLQNRDRSAAGTQLSDFSRVTGETFDSVDFPHPPTSTADERDVESDDDEGRHVAHHTHTHSASVTQCQNPLEPLNKLCPFCDKCDYLLVDGPPYLRSPCYHCRIASAEKEGLTGHQLYRLHTQHRVPWPLYLQKYFNWPPTERVTHEAILADCKWRSRVVCVCSPTLDIWPPCVEFPWLYNPPQSSIAYDMQVEQFSRGLSQASSLQSVSLWCRHPSQDLKRNLSRNFMPSDILQRTVNGAPNPTLRSKGRDPELSARTTRRSRSLTVGPNDQALWKQLLLMSQTTSLAAARAMGTFWDSQDGSSTMPNISSLTRSATQLSPTLPHATNSTSAIEPITGVPADGGGSVSSATIGNSDSIKNGSEKK